MFTDTSEEDNFEWEVENAMRKDVTLSRSEAIEKVLHGPN